MFLSALPRADRFERPALLDGGADQLRRALGIGLRPALELRGGPTDQPARRAIAASVQARVAVRAMDLERAVRLEEAHALGLFDQPADLVLSRHLKPSRLPSTSCASAQYASTTDFFSR